MSYARQKFWEAINCLVGDGPIEIRLSSAGQYLTVLNAEDLPEEERADFTEIMQSLTRFSPERTGEGRLHASARNLSSAEATELAEKILSVYTALRGGI